MALYPCDGKAAVMPIVDFIYTESYSSTLEFMLAVNGSLGVPVVKVSVVKVSLVTIESS